MGRVIRIWRKEPVLCIAALCALGSMLPVPPSAAYAGYTDWKVLALLWCLMAVVAGFRRSGIFDLLTYRLLSGSRGSTRRLAVLLILLPFFTSMLVTNDVALLTFVPFTLMLLDSAHCAGSAIPILVLQTMAANLGSMATPVGNPQNLFLYAYYDLTMGQFLSILGPLTLVSLIGLTAAALPVLPREIPAVTLQRPEKLNKREFCLEAALFALCLLSVLRVLPWYVLLPILAVTLLLCDRELLKEPDYALLATFVCFFIFSGNLGGIPAVQSFLHRLLDRSTLLTALLSSQLISNVPAAVLLAPFTEDSRGLLLGVDIGGLGTPVASLASLITLKLYLKREGADGKHFLLLFTVANFAAIAMLLLCVRLWRESFC